LNNSRREVDRLVSIDGFEIACSALRQRDQLGL
jgi:hypothetical protein